MYTPISIIEGDCIDPDFVSTLYDNVEYFEECSRAAPTRFVCQRIDGTASGQLQENICFTLPTANPNENPSLSVEDEQKLLLFDFSETKEGFTANFDATLSSRDMTIVCDGEVVDTFTGSETNVSLIMSSFKCGPNSEIQICVKSSYNFEFFTNRNGRRTIKFCGVLACLKNVQAGKVEGVFLPPPVDRNCCYGREAIHLAIQNVGALRSAYAEFGQVPSTRQIVFQDADTHVVLSDAATETEYLLLGQARICVKNSSKQSSAVIRVTPIIECQGERIRCLTREVSLRAVDRDGLASVNERCFSVPILSCGTCPPGADLTISLREQVDCGEEPEPEVSGLGTITSAVQNYCLYTFERQVNDFGDDLDPSLGRCIEPETYQLLADSMEQLNDVCSNQTDVQLTTFEKRGFAGAGQPITIRPPSPWPPLAPPERPVPDPAPVKRWYANIRLTACGSRNERPNGSGIAYATATARLYCGGRLLDTSSARWRIVDRDFYDRCQSLPSFRTCYECPIDEPITIEFESEISGSSAGVSAPRSLTVDARAFCI